MRLADAQTQKAAGIGMEQESREALPEQRERLSPLVEYLDSGAAGRRDAQCRGESGTPNLPG